MRASFFKLAPERQAEILDVAGQEFAEHGFDNASLNRIIAAAGLSKGAFYHHFENKLQLARAVLVRFFARFAAAIGQLPQRFDADAFWEFVTKVYREGLEIYRDDPTVAGLARASVKVGLGTRASDRDELGSAMRDWILLLVNAGQSVGAVRDDLPQSLLIGLVLGLADTIDTWWCENATTHADQDLDALAAAIVTLLKDQLGSRDKSATTWLALSEREQAAKE